MIPSASVPFPTPHFSQPFSFISLHLSPFCSFSLPNPLWPFDPLLTSITHLLKGDYYSISGRWSISNIFTLTFEALICLLSHRVGMVSLLCFLTCVWIGPRKTGRKFQANHFFWKILVLSNRKTQQRWVSLPHFSRKLWDPFEPRQTSLLTLLQNWGSEDFCSWSHRKPIAWASPMTVSIPVSDDFQNLGISLLIWRNPNVNNINMLPQNWAVSFFTAPMQAAQY